MSELTQCNYCSLQHYHSEAKAKQLKVTVLPDAKFGLGGVNVYVHPKDVSIKELSGGEDGERKQYRQAWFMELPERCCCD